MKRGELSNLGGEWAGMNDNQSGGRLAVVVVIIVMLAFVAVVGFAAVGSYLEYRTSKRISQERMQRVAGPQIEEREASAAQREVYSPVEVKP